MSSTTAHFLVGAALSLPATRSRALASILPRWIIPCLSGVLAATPDLDLGLKRLVHVPSGSLFAHRGFFHSPFFLICAAAVLAALVVRGRSRRAFWQLWACWAVCMVSHPLLDALSNGGNGVMLLFPFSRVRLFFPWRPIFNPAGSGKTLLSRAWFLRGSELGFCVAAAAAGLIGLRMANRSRHPG